MAFSKTEMKKSWIVEGEDENALKWNLIKTNNIDATLFLLHERYSVVLLDNCEGNFYSFGVSLFFFVSTRSRFCKESSIFHSEFFRPVTKFLSLACYT